MRHKSMLLPDYGQIQKMRVRRALQPRRFWEALNMNLFISWSKAVSDYKDIINLWWLELYMKKEMMLTLRASNSDANEYYFH